MKKIFVLAAVAVFMTSVFAFANGDDKSKNKSGKAKTECCKKHCSKPGKPCCDKSKCVKG